jgi:Zn-dependent peptidase ImmA (M78 family)
MPPTPTSGRCARPARSLVLERVVRLPPVSLPNPQTSVTSVRSGATTAAKHDDDEALFTMQDSNADGPAQAARRLRRAWKLARGPLPHLLRHIETHGVIVATARFGASDRIDAFSCWVQALSRPIMCLTRERRNVLRRRYSAAHELGHLLLHRRAAPGNAQHEREADRFAAELLMPADDIAAVLPRRLDLAQLIELQQQWGVSVQALLRRCHELSTISPTIYQRGMAAINRLGWGHDEPALDYNGEWPAMLAEALNLARPHGLNEQILSQGLSLPASEIQEMLGLVDDERPQLQLVTTAEHRRQSPLDIPRP